MPDPERSPASVGIDNKAPNYGAQGVFNGPVYFGIGSLAARDRIDRDKRSRERMRERVYTFWIKGILEQSLHGAALMVLGLEEKADVLDNPWRLLLQEADHRPTQPLPEGTRITQVYNATQGGLLILGEPGAGKTTLLLELARDLLERAQTSENAPIPVVFNLSSWAEKRPALSDWLVGELSIRYEVPRWLGKSWVSEGRLLLLLDGLDEVASAARTQCIEAINSYRQMHPDIQVVVCSRSSEYLNEPIQLRLLTAVVIQPLTQEQIDTYLVSVGEQAKALREALHQDADLRELATTPLMLSILTLAYQGKSAEDLLKEGSLETRRRQIFATYVKGMLNRRGASKRYQPKQITHWLAYLAQQMRRRNQSIFYIDQMQPDWLPKVMPGSLYRLLAGGVSGGLLCGLIGAVVGIIISLAGALSGSNVFISFLYTPIPWPAIIAGLITGLIIGQILGSLIGLFRPKITEISTVEVISWSWANARLAAIAAMVGWSLGELILFHSSSFLNNLSTSLVSHVPTYSFLYVSLEFIELFIIFFILITPEWICFIMIYLFVFRNLDAHSSIISKQRIWYAARSGARVGIFMFCFGLTLVLLTGSVTNKLGLTGIYFDIYLVAMGCVTGLLTGLVSGVSHRQLETHASLKPNQGIWRSLYNGASVLLIAGLIAWLIYDLLSIVLYRLAVSQVASLGNIVFPSQQLLTGVIVGISIGLFFGLLNGGIACIKHVLLRIFLWRAGVLPWNCVHFLDHATERILLRKVGSGYIFVHRLLLEYFALSVTSFPEEAPVVAVASDEPPVLPSTSQIAIGLPEEKVSLPVSRRKTGFNTEKRIVLLFVVVLLLEFICGPSIVGVVQRAAQKTNNAVATAQTEADDAVATSTARAWATANASIIAANPNPYSGGTMVLYDPLSKPIKWYTGSDASFGGTCQFTMGAYHISQSKPHRTFHCSEGGDFSNFTFEVQMTITKGDCGGVVFREGSGGKLYYFAVCRDRHYLLVLYVDHTSTNAKVLSGEYSSSINTELNVPNVIAVVANGSTLGLYVNKQKIASVTNSTLSHGTIGLGASDTSNATEVAYRTARVWTVL